MFNRLDEGLSDPKFNQHYHADFIELLALTENENGIEFDRVKDIYNCEQSFIDDLIILINSRVDIYGDKFPFVFIGRTRLALKSELTDSHKLYIFLLLCSNTSRVEVACDLRRDFEIISYQAMKAYLPPHSHCYIMGKSGIEGQRYCGHISDKLELLAEDLSTSIIYDAGTFSAYNSGDGGLDIVAWTPFVGDENLNYMPMYAGQCATGRDWLNKQDEPSKLAGYVKVPKSFNVCLFIPYDGRNNDGTVNQRSNILVPILFDRLRILNLFDYHNHSFIAEIASIKEHVESAISYQEDII